MMRSVGMSRGFLLMSGTIFESKGLVPAFFFSVIDRREDHDSFNARRD